MLQEFPSTKSKIIQQVVRNYENRLLSRKSMSSPRYMSKRTAPPTPKLVQRVGVTSCVEKPAESSSFVPPPPRNVRLQFEVAEIAEMNDLKRNHAPGIESPLREPPLHTENFKYCGDNRIIARSTYRASCDDVVSSAGGAAAPPPDLKNKILKVKNIGNGIIIHGHELGNKIILARIQYYIILMTYLSLVLLFLGLYSKRDIHCI